jgi:hypothetical protein
MTIHPSWVKVGGFPLEIMEGKHDDNLESIQNACKVRLKSMFRKGQRCRLTGTHNVELDGKLVTIIKVNAKSISVGVGEPEIVGGRRNPPYFPEGSYNVPPRMLEAV